MRILNKIRCVFQVRSQFTAIQHTKKEHQTGVMGKPTLFVALRSDYDLRRISEKLDDKFDINYWPHNRAPSQDEMIANAKGVFGIICSSWTVIDSEIINAAGDNLKIIMTTSTGYNHIDLKASKAKGIRIGYERSLVEKNVTVAEYAIGLLLATARHIANNHLDVRKNVDCWDRKKLNFTQHQTICDSVVGIVGCGNIGIEIVKRLRVFSPKTILYCSRKSKSEVDAIGGEWQSVDDICKNSDFIMVTAELNEETYHLINQARLDSMKPNAILVNVSRGGLIDENALVDALKNRKIAGAGLDVLEEEPIHPNNPLLNLDNVVVTPHVAWCSSVVWNRRLDIAVENILAVLENREMTSELL